MVNHSNSLNVPITCEKEDDVVECTFSQRINLKPSVKINLITAKDRNKIDGLRISSPSTGTTIPTEIFEQLPSLKSLTIGSLEIESLSKEHLQGANNLERLVIYASKVKSLPANITAFAPRLEAIQIPGKSLENVENGAFNSLAIKQIDLAVNRLSSLKGKMFSGATNIEHINLSFNWIDQIEEGTFDLPKLNFIILRYNRLKTLPTNLFVNTPLLKHVQLEDNELTNILDVVDKVQILESLNLASNPTLKEDILPSLHRLPHLNTLDLSSTAPTSFIASSSPNLKHLVMSEVGLNDSGILHYLRRLDMLEVLDLSYSLLNKVDNFDKVLDFFPHLSSLDLRKSGKWDTEWKQSAKKFCRKKKLHCQLEL